MNKKYPRLNCVDKFWADNMLYDFYNPEPCTFGRSWSSHASVERQQTKLWVHRYEDVKMSELKYEP